jgi:hypothetical protein
MGFIIAGGQASVDSLWPRTNDDRVTCEGMFDYHTSFTQLNDGMKNQLKRCFIRGNVVPYRLFCATVFGEFLRCYSSYEQLNADDKETLDCVMRMWVMISVDPRNALTWLETAAHISNVSFCGITLSEADSIKLRIMIAGLKLSGNLHLLATSYTFDGMRIEIVTDDFQRHTFDSRSFTSFMPLILTQVNIATVYVSPGAYRLKHMLPSYYYSVPTSLVAS